MKTANGPITRKEMGGNKSGSINRYLNQNRMKQEGSDITEAMNYQIQKSFVCDSEVQMMRYVAATF